MSRRSVPARKSSMRSCSIERAVAQVQRLVLDQQPDELAVGDVDDRLAVLGVAVARLRVRQRALLEEAVEVGAREAARLALLERCRACRCARWTARTPTRSAPAASRSSADLRAAASGSTLEAAVDHGVLQQLREVVDHDVRAVRPQRVGLADPVDAHDVAEVARPGRPAPRRARPRRPPPWPAPTPSARRPARNVSGAGLPRRPPLGDDHAVDPGLDEAAKPGGVEHVLAVGRRGDDRDPQAGLRAASGSAPSRDTARRHARPDLLSTSSFLRLPTPWTVSRRTGRSGGPPAA